jgi:acyl carrier protein
VVLGFDRLRSGPFEGPAIVKPPALPGDTYFKEIFGFVPRLSDWHSICCGMSSILSGHNATPRMRPEMQGIIPVREFLVENFLFGEGDHLEETTSLLENGVIDSTGMLELVTFLEQTYHITIEDDDLIPENLDSLRSIAKFLKRKLNGG